MKAVSLFAFTSLFGNVYGFPFFSMSLLTHIQIFTGIKHQFEVCTYKIYKQFRWHYLKWHKNSVKPYTRNKPYDVKRSKRRVLMRLRLATSEFWTQLNIYPYMGFAQEQRTQQQQQQHHFTSYASMYMDIMVAFVCVYGIKTALNIYKACINGPKRLL